MKRKLAIVLAFLALAATPAVAAFTSVNEIILSIGTSQFLRAAERVDSASAARVERLSTYLGAATAGPRLARVRATYARDIRYLQRNLRMNFMAMHAIRSAGLEVTDIVALTVDSDGSAILYADDLK